MNNIKFSDVDRGKCPLCGKPNNCNIVTGKGSPHSCWCKEVTIPKELLEKVSNREGNSVGVCICKRCIDNYNNFKFQK